MPSYRPERVSFRLQNPDLEIVVTDDGSRTLRRVADGVTWHSESGAISESKLVFLENSRVAELLANGQSVRVLEVGFGTGLNFWVTATAALKTDTPLNYVSVEPQLIDKYVVDELKHDELQQCQPAFDLFHESIFLNQAAGSLTTTASIKAVSLRIIHSDAPFNDGLDSPAAFDAVYHDPFDPEAAPELWTESCFKRLHRQLRLGGRLVTYCVKSDVQRTLKSAGFRVFKTRGPIGGKREVLIAEKF